MAPTAELEVVLVAVAWAVGPVEVGLGDGRDESAGIR